MISGKRARAALGGSVILAGLVLAGAALVGGFGAETDEQVFIAFAINLVFALGVQAFVGSAGIVSFGHLAFAAIGAYVAGILTTPTSIKMSSIPDAPSLFIDASMSFVPATAVAILVVCVVAAVIGVPLMRLNGNEAGIATYAMLVIVQVLLLNADTVTRGSQTFYGLPAETGLWSAAAFAVLALLAVRFVRDSNAGLSLRATQGSSLAAESSGVRTTRVRLFAWVASAGVMALGGSLYAHLVTAFSPNNFSLVLTFTVLTMVVLGGQSVTGAFVGATLVTAVTETLRRSVDDVTIAGWTIEGALLTPIVLGVITILVLILRPRGLVGRLEVERLPAAILSRIGRRRSAQAPEG